MTITFENDNDVIVYALQKVISCARITQQIFVAQCVWWLAGLIGLEESLVKHIDNCNGRTTVGKEQGTKEVSEPAIQNTTEIQDSKDQGSKEDHQDKILEECEEYLRESRQLRDTATLKSKGKTQSGRIDPTPISKKFLGKKDRYKRKAAVPAEAVSKKEGKRKNGGDYSKTYGIIESEIQRRKSSGECLRCAWPADRKGFHRVKDCIRPIKLAEGTAAFPMSKEYQQQPIVQEASSDAISSEESADDSL